MKEGTLCFQTICNCIYHSRQSPPPKKQQRATVFVLLVEAEGAFGRGVYGQLRNKEMIYEGDSKTTRTLAAKIISIKTFPDPSLS